MSNKDTAEGRPTLGGTRGGAGGSVGVVTVTSPNNTINVTNPGGPSVGVDVIPNTWATQRQPAILAIAPTLTEAHPLTTMNLTPDWEDGAAVGSADVGPSGVANGGSLRALTGATPNSVRVCRTLNAASGAIWVTNQKTVPWAIAMRIKIGTTPDAQTLLCLMSMATASTDVMLAVHGATSTTTLTLRVNGSGANNTDTFQPFVVGAYHNLALVFDLTTLWLVYDDVKISTGMTNLSNFDPAVAFARFFPSNGTTAANQRFDICQAAVYTPPAI